MNRPLALALASLFLIALLGAGCNSGTSPCPTGTCNCTYSGNGSWSCFEQSVPACPSDATPAFTASSVACSYRGPECVFCQGGDNGGGGVAVWCTCGSAAAKADGGSGGQVWSCAPRGGATCTGP